ncbi:TetR family transcriptional regulator C-terminal domain-containing protein [Streptomyces sp. NPDC087512]|uniref:TetR/AcrR family transcriptional regulator n=1 Tax=unclassified Streptomyces TaxID=2593676 RepID=UPI00341BAB15
MESRGAGKQIRKPPAERRNEIVGAAAQVALAEGLECVTLRRVAERLGVRAGLVGHYFPVAEELVAEAFASATMAELDSLLPEVGPGEGGDVALRTVRRLLARISGAEFDDVSRLWLNARHLSRYRPVLREQVVSQELLWCRRLGQVVAEGVDGGVFVCADPWAAAVRVLVAIDGTGSYVNTSADRRGAAVGGLVRALAEAELGLDPGALGPA